MDAVVNQLYVPLRTWEENRLRSLGNGHLNQLDMAVQRKVNCSALVPSELPKYMLQQSALFWKSRTKSIANGNVVY